MQKGGKRKGLVYIRSRAALCPHAAASSRCVNIDNRWRLKRENEGKMEEGREGKRRSEQLG